MMPGLDDLNKIVDITDVKKTNESINLTTNTKMFQSANMASKVLGELAPQTVQAFEKEDLPLNERWYHIKSDWVGDARIKVDPAETR
jgi:hypothetical protein